MFYCSILHLYKAHTVGSAKVWYPKFNYFLFLPTLFFVVAQVGPPQKIQKPRNCYPKHKFCLHVELTMGRWECAGCDMLSVRQTGLPRLWPWPVEHSLALLLSLCEPPHPVSSDVQILV